jgi:branched-chain amino acid transport system substrate-binding protein
MRVKKWIIGIGVLFMSIVLVLGAVWATEKPIKLGVVFIMSGKMGGYGKHGTQAVQLALDEINEQGGILGTRVEAIFADDELKVDKGVQITKKFIKNRAEYPTCKGGDESPRAEGTKNMI